MVLAQNTVHSLCWGSQAASGAQVLRTVGSFAITSMVRCADQWIRSFELAYPISFVVHPHVQSMCHVPSGP
jgi:hypothetical protein